VGATTKLKRRLDVMAGNDSPSDREAKIYRLDRPDHREWVSKPVLAAMRKKSTRWVELKMREGMPSILDEKGERRYNVNEVEAWLVAHPKRTAPVDRVGALETRVAALEAIVERLAR
jgi:hypothetical protein